MFEWGYHIKRLAKYFEKAFTEMQLLFIIPIFGMQQRNIYAYFVFERIKLFLLNCFTLLWDTFLAYCWATFRYQEMLISSEIKSFGQNTFEVNECIFEMVYLYESCCKSGLCVVCNRSRWKIPDQIVTDVYLLAILLECMKKDTSESKCSSTNFTWSFLEYFVPNIQ